MSAHSSRYKVRHAVSDKELAHILALDKNMHGEGFEEPNRLGDDALIDLWRRDKLGFYVVYDSADNPIGYCDIFGMNPDCKFIQSELIEQPVGVLNLPKTDTLCNAIIEVGWI